MMRKKLLLLSVSLLSGMAAQAKDLAPYLAASQVFSKQATAAIQQNSMPRLTDPEAQPVINTLSDHQRFLDVHRFTPAELDGLTKVCHTANQVSVSYALFDLNRRVDFQGARTNAAIQTADVVRQNTYAFQQELSLLQPFLLRCIAKQLAPLADMVTALPDRARDKVRTKTQLAQLRGLTERLSGNYGSVFDLIADENLSPAFKRAMLSTLADVADEVQAAMPLSSRQTVLADLSALDPAAKAPFVQYLDRIAAAMGNTGCEGLCALD